MAISQVIFNDSKLIDLTNDTVTPEGLQKGLTAHDKSGAQITGSMESKDLLHILKPKIDGDIDTITQNGTYTLTIEDLPLDEIVEAFVNNEKILADTETITVNVSATINLQTKTVTPTTSQQTVTPDSGYDGLSSVTVSKVNLQTKSVSPSTSSQTVTPDNGYAGLASVTISAMNLQSKSTTITPGANWSSSTTNPTTISPDSGYDGMSQVSVFTPMCRDYMLFTAKTVETPSTVYNGDTAQSNSEKCLRIAPTKDGMCYTGSYFELKGSSYLGDATASDVVSGKTFSSSAGIQVTGTGSSGTDTSDATLDGGNRMLSGYTAYAKGTKYTGSITSIPSNVYTPGTLDQTIQLGTYLAGSQIIKGDTNLLAANIKKGVTIFNVTGTAETVTADNFQLLYSEDPYVQKTSITKEMDASSWIDTYRYLYVYCGRSQPSISGASAYDYYTAAGQKEIYGGSIIIDLRLIKDKPTTYLGLNFVYATDTGYSIDVYIYGNSYPNTSLTGKFRYTPVKSMSSAKYCVTVYGLY